MPEIQQPVPAVRVDFTCDDCGRGHYRPTGMLGLTVPPRHQHKCDYCGHEQFLPKRYPFLKRA
tara:strand:+ start:134 stop:322 length:189 start_codon:yes stop_codon:yes gene_type:complete